MKIIHIVRGPCWRGSQLLLDKLALENRVDTASYFYCAKVELENDTPDKIHKSAVNGDLRKMMEDIEKDLKDPVYRYTKVLILRGLFLSASLTGYIEQVIKQTLKDVKIYNHTPVPQTIYDLVMERDKLLSENENGIEMVDVDKAMFELFQETIRTEEYPKPVKKRDYFAGEKCPSCGNYLSLAHVDSKVVPNNPNFGEGYTGVRVHEVFCRKCGFSGGRNTSSKKFDFMGALESASAFAGKTRG